MKLFNKLSITSLLLSLFVLAPAVSAEVVVITNPSNSASLSESDVKRIFLGKMKSFPGGGTILSVNQSAGSDVRKTFDKEALGKSPSQMKAYWSKLVFSGKGNPPKELANDAEVIKLVAENPAVIGYIDAANKTSDVKVVATYK
jgi:hypothetical protein